MACCNLMLNIFNEGHCFFSNTSCRLRLVFVSSLSFSRRLFLITIYIVRLLYFENIKHNLGNHFLAKLASWAAWLPLVLFFLHFIIKARLIRASMKFIVLMVCGSDWKYQQWLQCVFLWSYRLSELTAVVDQMAMSPAKTAGKEKTFTPIYTALYIFTGKSQSATRT